MVSWLYDNAHDDYTEEFRTAEGSLRVADAFDRKADEMGGKTDG